MITPPQVIDNKRTAAAIIHLTIPAREMGKHMDPAIQEVLKAMTEQGVHPVGAMFCYHYRRPTDTFDFDIGFPVSKAINESGRVKPGTLPTARVVRTVYQGPYEGLAQAWGALQAWVREQKLDGSGRFWECYLNNPNEVKSPNEYRTELNWVVNGC